MQDKDFENAVDYVHSLGEFGWKLGLERFEDLCERLGNPQGKLKIIHVGGTNGKGSTTAMVSSILKSAGYRVGTYYSPYVYNIRERIQLDGGMISREAFTRHIDAIRPHAAAIGETELEHPTEFEVKTALAFLYFVEQGVDFAVMEVGLGGRLDATNIANPLVSIITNVTLDHMDRLGDTIPQIAYEKAGIIKKNGHLVTAVADADAFPVIRSTCEERNSSLRHVHSVDGSANVLAVTNISPKQDHSFPSTISNSSHDNALLTVFGDGYRYADLKIGMLGDFQLVNAATAIGAIEVLAQQGIQVPENALRAGLETAYLPGRLEVLQRNPTLLIDGAHNIDGACNLAEALKSRFKYNKLILVIGMVTGHSIDDVVGILAPIADKFITTVSQSARAAAPETVAEVARKYCADVDLTASVEEAVDHALQCAHPDDLICVTGSFYTIGEVPRPQNESSSEV